ncbi:NACHT domain-containing protein [Streptomyces klenkii]|uniref:NACHT domain-containing protein n=1 Tax=Streptomyces klenkii TaxID=1420899 RepID=UPI0036E0F726
MRYLLLFVLAVAAALALAQYFDAGVPATTIAVLLALPAAYLAWAAFRADRDEADDVGVEAAADRLAVAVRVQWAQEASFRRVNDPYPLPVAWRAADEDMTEPWPLLTDLARAWPGGPPGDPARWPSDGAGLAGQDAEIGEVFADRVPTRRLVILGEPGAGKSVLLIRLLLDLIDRRADGAPVPVLFSLASWNPSQPLMAWLAGQLRRVYPDLRHFVPGQAASADGPGDLAQALLDAGRILPLLDGFDELPPALHPVALDALNRALPAKQPLVLTSRAAAYRSALARPDDTAAVRLNGATAIQMLPVDPGQAAVYLRRDAGGPDTPAARRWDTVTAWLGTDTPVGHALSTPLGLFLARTIYTPRPQATPVSWVPHPDELCDTTAFPDRAAVDTHLFSAFIPAAYSPGSPRPPRWTAEQAHRTLAFLARFLQTHRGGSPELAWWDLPRILPMYVYRVAAGLGAGLGAGLMARLTAGPTVGIGTGLMIGLAVGLGARLTAGTMAGTMAGIVVGHVAGIAVGIAAGLVVGLVAWLGAGLVFRRGVGGVHAPSARLHWSPIGLWFGIVAWLAAVRGFGLAAGLAAGLGGVLAFGLVSERPDQATNTAPVMLLSSDRRTFIAFVLAVGSTFGLAAGLAAGLDFGLAVGLGLGLGSGLTNSTWAYFVMARTYLTVRRKVPRDLMAFLQDAHMYRGVLRQVGAVYQFRHIDLQRHLAQQQP